MTSERLIQAISVDPFLPFTLHLADGRNLTVNDPRQLSVAAGQRTLLLRVPPSRLLIIDLLLIVDLEYELAPSVRGNGRMRDN